MNRYRKLIGGTWALVALVAVAAIGAWSTAVPALVTGNITATRNDGVKVRFRSPFDSLGLASMVVNIRNHDPFRFDRKKALMRFNPWGQVSQPVAAPPVPARPTLNLAGIVGGPPWTALVEGVPGREGGVLIRFGEQAGGIELTAVKGDTVVLTGFDTTWVLRVRPAWQ